MRSTSLIATLTAAAALAAAGSASADTYCVGAPTACPAGAPVHSGVQAGLDAAVGHAGHDTVLIGAGTFTTPAMLGYFTADPQNTVEVRGEGDATVLKADTAAKPGSFAVMYLKATAPSVVSDLKIVVPNATDVGAKPIGLMLYGGAAAESLEITDSGALSLGADLGISMAGGAVRDTTIHMNENADGIGLSSAAPVSITGSEIRAERGIFAPAEADATVRRTTIVAQDGGMLMRGGALRAESTLVRITGTNGYGVRAQGYAAARPLTQVDLSHVTLTGTVAPNTFGIDVKAVDDGDAAVNIDNSIISGFGHGINRVSTDVGGEGAADLTATNVNYSAAADVSQGSGQLIINDASTLAPGFLDPANGDFRIGSSSPMVDFGRSDTFVPLDELDLAGGQRTVGGARDLGAYEYQAAAPVAVIAGASSTVAGDALALSGAQSHADGDPGEQVVTWQWSFGDGATAGGASVSHAWSQPGTYEVALTVVDSGGQSHTVKSSVVVAAKPVTTAQDACCVPGGGDLPSDGTGGAGGPTPVSEEPRRETAPADTVAPAISALSRRGRTVRLSLSESASLTLRVERRRGARFRAASAPKTVRGVAGANVLRIAKLRAGSYRLVVTATDAAGNRTVKRLAFRVAA